jgi:hypothetical protein
MTEAGEKWADAQRRSGLWKSPAAEADFWLRAFCADVENRAKQLAMGNSHGVPHDPNFVDYSEAFDELHQELLGEKQK